MCSRNDQTWAQWVGSTHGPVIPPVDIIVRILYTVHLGYPGSSLCFISSNISTPLVCTRCSRNHDTWAQWVGSTHGSVHLRRRNQILPNHPGSDCSMHQEYLFLILQLNKVFLAKTGKIKPGKSGRMYCREFTIIWQIQNSNQSREFITLHTGD